MQTHSTQKSTSYMSTSYIFRLRSAYSSSSQYIGFLAFSGYCFECTGVTQHCPSVRAVQVELDKAESSVLNSQTKTISELVFP